MIAYKVVCGKKVFRPATSFALQSIRYRLNETTEIDKYTAGPIAVFSDLVYAQKFLEEYGDCILEVECEECKDESKLWKKLPPHFHKKRGSYYAESSGEVSKWLNECPTGTILTRKLFVKSIVQTKETK